MHGGVVPALYYLIEAFASFLLVVFAVVDNIVQTFGRFANFGEILVLGNASKSVFYCRLGWRLEDAGLLFG